MLDIISFGSAIVDVFLRPISVEDFSKEKVEVEKKLVVSGGGGTNAAVSFSRLGLASALVARLGRDLFGKMIVDELKGERVNVDLLNQEDEETDLSVILVRSDGSRTIFVSRGKTRLEEKNINWGKLFSSWFYLSSLEGNLPLVEKIVGFAENNNIKVAWNPGERELKMRNEVKRIARKLEVLILNQGEADEIFGQGEKELLAKINIITHGKEGASLYSNQKELFIATPQREAVDETGAGDAFGSGFVAGLVKGMELKEAFDLAMRNGVSVVQHIGAKEGLLKISNV